MSPRRETPDAPEAADDRELDDADVPELEDGLRELSLFAAPERLPVTQQIGAVAPHLGDRFSRRAGVRERWVCNACGQYTAVGAALSDLPRACLLTAVLCHARPDPTDNKWVKAPMIDPTLS